MDDNLKNLLIMAVIGILAGFLASLLVGGSGGIIRYLISGILGAFVGGYLFRALGINLGITDALLSQIVTSTIGAVIVLLIAQFIG